MASSEQDPIELAEEDRTFNLDRAAALYREILGADSGDLDTVVITYTAMNGLAAVAECNGDLDAASDWYGKAAERASGHFPYLAERARSRGAASAPPSPPWRCRWRRRPLSRAPPGSSR